MLAWVRKLKAARLDRAALVEADAKGLIAQFGAQAYYVARDRDRDERAGGIIDAERPRRHWSAVRLRVAALSGRQGGPDTATRYLKAD